jgi:hypothetical protein
MQPDVKSDPPQVWTGLDLGAMPPHLLRALIDGYQQRFGEGHTPSTRDELAYAELLAEWDRRRMAKAVAS